MDEITLNGLEFFGFHGCLSSEKKHGQLFIVDVNMKICLLNAGKSDDLKDTIDYTKVVELVKNIVEGESKNLIESLAETIAREILNKFAKVERVTVCVHKPHVPLGSVIRDVAVKIMRER